MGVEPLVKGGNPLLQTIKIFHFYEIIGYHGKHAYGKPNIVTKKIDIF